MDVENEMAQLLEANKAKPKVGGKKAKHLQRDQVCIGGILAWMGHTGTDSSRLLTALYKRDFYLLGTFSTLVLEEYLYPHGA